jgi:hypothetical protein
VDVWTSIRLNEQTPGNPGRGSFFNLLSTGRTDTPRSAFTSFRCAAEAFDFRANLAGECLELQLPVWQLPKLLKGTSENYISELG